ncbi:MAG: hypothetical protein R3B53_02400 [Candidatus Paceibacterota bacterium]
MLINTRNFLLYLLCVGFLVIAIVATFSRQGIDRSESVVSVEPLSDSEVAVYTAEVTAGHQIDREGNLASLRNRINSLPKNEIIKPPVIAEEPAVVVSNAKPTLLECSDYVSPKTFKLATGVQFEVIRGARIAYYDVEVLVDPLATNTTTTMSKDVVLQLPIRSFPMSERTVYLTMWLV